MLPHEDYFDSEEENDPLCQVEIEQIDLFSDVNEGEKAVMKLWNLHLMKHKLIPVACQMPLICEMFVDIYGSEIIRKKLYRNFVLHMCCLFDFELLSPEAVYKVVDKLQEMASHVPADQEIMKIQRHATLENWLGMGMDKQDLRITPDLNNNPEYESSISTENRTK